MTDPASGSFDGDQLRQFLEQVLGGSVPEGALEGIDFEELAKQSGLPTDPMQLQAAAAALRNMMNAQGDAPVNWTMARDLARQVALGTTPLTTVPGLPEPAGTPGDPSPGAVQQREFGEAFHIASLWLEPVTEFDGVADAPVVWSRSEWVERTLPRWQELTEPVAKHMAQALGQALSSQLGQLPPGLPMGDLDPSAMMKQVGGTLYGVQFGQAIGSLAREVLSGTDLGLPMNPDGGPAALPVNVADFLDGVDIDPVAARIFLAMRELAHVELFRSVPWLQEHLFGSIASFARSTRIDLGSLEELVRDIDISDPTALQDALPVGIFEFTRNADQERALGELATTLALVEGWVDHVTAQALAERLPQLEALREIMHRRRAAGGPAEQLFAGVVGLELRPRRIREATDWWDSVHETEGAAGRENVWRHPDLLPSADVLSGRPQAPRTRDDVDTAMNDLDAELEELLSAADAERRDDEDPEADPGTPGRDA